MYSMCASTLEVISSNYSRAHARCDYANMRGVGLRSKAYPPGVQLLSLSKSKINVENHSIPHIRLAAFVARDLYSPVSNVEGSHAITHWPYFDYTKTQHTSEPSSILHMLYQQSQCHPINIDPIWKENKAHIPMFTLINSLLADTTIDSTTKTLLSQLHTVGTLALAGLSEVMYIELKFLFASLLDQLEQTTCHRSNDFAKIEIPNKVHFVNAMRHSLLPWQNIGAFSHYTHWLIQYRKTLSPSTSDFDAALHAIVTKQINAFLSPPWHFEKTFLHLQEDWRTALWIPDEYVKGFLEHAKTQSSEECTFIQMVQAQEKSATSYLNAMKCCEFYTLSLTTMQHVLKDKDLENLPADAHKVVWDAAATMLSMDIPIDSTRTVQHTLRAPQTIYKNSTVKPLFFVEPPQAKHFTPGSAHLKQAQDWHRNLTLWYEKMTDVSPTTLPVEECAPFTWEIHKRT